MSDDEFFTINGVEVTPRMLAEARQELARRSPFNAGFYPAFDELTEQEQKVSELEARNYLRALTALLPAKPGTVRVYAVANLRKGRIHGLTCNVNQSVAWVQELIEQYGDPLAATQTVDVVDPAEQSIPWRRSDD
ncbi:hypothetical protein Ade02nite_19350 [Paractinoplanes deccanensis]|uniref:Uncharacterized protein n=1 Tax=Paractinoplanes deccanensis TaxID=113561 RepID=A0ABQ3XZW4_9ACTN|nr:hypothetical protein [Actinoplanes deccanensis]GID73294.1 hypothetical protein Ade02nite_19350 [Actinoplanes deccanensis]